MDSETQMKDKNALLRTKCYHGGEEGKKRGERRRVHTVDGELLLLRWAADWGEVEDGEALLLRWVCSSVHREAPPPHSMSPSPTPSSVNTAKSPSSGDRRVSTLRQ